MFKSVKKVTLFLFASFFVFKVAFTQQVYNHLNGAWKPLDDYEYLQEISLKIPTENPVTSVAVLGNTCFALMEGKVYKLNNNSLAEDKSAPKDVVQLLSEQGRVWATTPDGLFEHRKGEWEKTDSRVYVDMCTHFGQIHAAARDEIFKLENGRFVTTKPADGYHNSDITMLMEDGSQVHAYPVKLGPVSRIESYSGTLYVLRPGKLVLFDGKVVNDDFIDWGTLPSLNTNDMLSMGNRIYIGTDRGLAELRGAALTAIKGADGLPVERTTCLTKGFDDDLWIGSERGAIRLTKSGKFHYFSEGMWLPNQKVNAIAALDNKVYVATDGGIGVIQYEPFTLYKKAEWLQKHLEEWGYMRMGFVQFLYKKDGEWIREITDNDGGHTAPYLVAMCYKYAVTGDPEARAKAVDSFKSMVWLNKITEKDGFIARSIWSVSGDDDERSTTGSGGLPAKWYPTPDGKWFWKGDTSSDEATSHFYAVSIFYDLVAEGKEKEAAREHLKKMASYIIDCGWTMHDLDGKPTRWARWNPEYLLRPYGYADRGVNGLEILSFMQAAIEATGDQKFKDGYQQLIDWGYPENTIRQKNTFPPETIAPWDDDLALMSYFTLLRYEKDPVLRSIYLRSLERTWAVKRIERLPYFNFAYGILTGNEGEFEAASDFLREWVIDCRENSFFNSHRDDLFIEPGYTSYDGTIKMLSSREAYTNADGRRPDVLDGDRRGNRAIAPVAFLRDYWMGRYYGILKAPENTRIDLGSVPDVMEGDTGAEPYTGTPRPEIF